LGRTSTFRLLSTFFGLTPEAASEYRAAIFRQIHEIVFHGKGGYDWSTVYNMPIWLRRFTFNSINEWYKEQNEKAEGENKTPDIPKGPNINPSYTTKASN